jgi:hypothetical protein
VKARLRSLLVRYGIAIGSIVLATWLRFLLDPVLEDRFPFLGYFFAVMFVAW